MNISVLELLSIGLRELFTHRYKVLISMGCISFVVLLVGMTWKNKYETSITIYADNQNIIKPLLEGQATITTPKNERVRIVREIMFSQRSLEKVVEEGLGNPIDSGSSETEDLMTGLRNDIEISAPANNYIKVAYRHESPDACYKVVNSITNHFIEESAINKRAESKNAYTFIDEQVKSYKDQLIAAETKLKAFESANVDGREGEVTAAIARLRSTIDEIEIDMEADEIRIAALEAQLSDEGRYAAADYSAVVYRDRLAQLESTLSSLKLNYRDEHPDIIDIKLQIADLKKTIVEVESKNNSKEALSGEANLNPIYEELSNQLSTSKVDHKAKTHRLKAYKSRLEDQYARRMRVASNQAEYSGLTRDYSVTKQIYEDLLERKEKARISMTLDLVGQGVSYKVLEPAIYPTLPVGIRFVHFAMTGPVFGLLLPAGLVVLFLFIDTRIRLPSQIEDQFPGLVLATITEEKRDYSDLRRVGLYLLAGFSVYAGLAITFRLLV